MYSLSSSFTNSPLFRKTCHPIYTTASGFRDGHFLLELPTNTACRFLYWTSIPFFWGERSYYQWQSPTRNVTPSGVYHLASPQFEIADRLVFIDIDQGEELRCPSSQVLILLHSPTLQGQKPWILQLQNPISCRDLRVPFIVLLSFQRWYPRQVSIFTEIAYFCCPGVVCWTSIREN